MASTVCRDFLSKAPGRVAEQSIDEHDWGGTLVEEVAVEAITVEGPKAAARKLEDVVVACVQQRLRIYANLAEYRVDLQRFLRIAQHKHAQLVIFPELAGIMLAPPLLRSQRLAMLKYADRSTRRHSSWQQRTMGRVARWGAAANAASMSP